MKHLRRIEGPIKEGNCLSMSSSISRRRDRKGIAIVLQYCQVLSIIGRQIRVVEAHGCCCAWERSGGCCCC